ncbi:MAG: hypothetical protein ABSG53_19025 [Thermoguttaceae bacterium]|jgi:hypothetical protein
MFRTCLTWKLRLALLATAGFGCLAAAAVAAPAAPAAAPAAAANGDMAAKKQILDSPAWQQAMFGFNQWLSVQVLYDKDQVAQIKAQLKDKVKKMSAAQLRAFLEDLQQKLAILGSKEAIAARAWAEDYLTHFTAAAGEKFRKTLPDVAKMTAAQLQQALYDLQQRREAEAASQSAFDQQRDQQVAAIRERNRLSAEADAQADSQAATIGGNPNPGNYGGYGGGYAPVSYSGQFYAPIYPGYLGGWRW